MTSPARSFLLASTLLAGMGLPGIDSASAMMNPRMSAAPTVRAKAGGVPMLRPNMSQVRPLNGFAQQAPRNLGASMVRPNMSQVRPLNGLSQQGPHNLGAAWQRSGGPIPALGNSVIGNGYGGNGAFANGRLPNGPLLPVNGAFANGGAPGGLPGAARDQRNGPGDAKGDASSGLPAARDQRNRDPKGGPSGGLPGPYNGIGNGAGTAIGNGLGNGLGNGVGNGPRDVNVNFPDLRNARSNGSAGAGVPSAGGNPGASGTQVPQAPALPINDDIVSTIPGWLEQWGGMNDPLAYGVGAFGPSVLGDDRKGDGTFKWPEGVRQSGASEDDGQGTGSLPTDGWGPGGAPRPDGFRDPTGKVSKPGDHWVREGHDGPVRGDSNGRGYTQYTDWGHNSATGERYNHVFVLYDDGEMRMTDTFSKDGNTHQEITVFPADSSDDVDAGEKPSEKQKTEKEKASQPAPEGYSSRGGANCGLEERHIRGPEDLGIQCGAPSRSTTGTARIVPREAEGSGTTGIRRQSPGWASDPNPDGSSGGGGGGGLPPVRCDNPDGCERPH